MIMRCSTFSELPPPPPGKTGWPWTGESPQLPDTIPDQDQHCDALLQPGLVSGGDDLFRASCGQAADVYIHSVKVDSFPNTVSEALACGTPVVATAVGGIPEQVKGLGTGDCRSRVEGWNGYDCEEATGVLVPPGDAEAMAEAIVVLLTKEALRKGLAKNAVRDAGKRFDLGRQVAEYLRWYENILLTLGG